MNMKRLTQLSFPYIRLLVALALIFQVSGTAFAAVWTDQADYAPGSTVTISGDNSDGAGYLAGETVHVDVSGPNGYTSACEATADANGAWSCQVTLWDSGLAVGSYTYTATGLSSEVSQEGTFTDGNVRAKYAGPATAPASFLLTFVGYTSTDCTTGAGATSTQTNTSTGTPAITNNDGQSVKLTAAATANNGSSFVNWTSTEAFTDLGGGSICVTGFATGTRDYFANYAAPVNTAPSNVTLTPSPATINENDSVTLNGSFTDPDSGQTHTVVISWGDGSPNTTLSLAAGVTTFSASHQYLDDNPTGTASDNYTISATVTDSASASASGSTSVTVNNVAPSAVSASLSGTSINENGSTSLSGSFTDPGTLDTHIVVINWGDGSANTTLSLAAGVLSFSGVSHTYLDDNPSGTSSDAYSISVTVTDDDTGSDSANASVTVNNVAPTLSNVMAAPATINENQGVILSGNLSDPGTLDTFTLSINWGDGSALQSVSLAAGTTSFSVSHTYLDDNPTGTPSDVNSISVMVADDDTGSASASTSVTVNNVAPSAVTAGAVTINENGTASLSGSFTDPGTLDTHTVVITWGAGEGNTTLNLAAGVTTFSASHQYLDDNPTGTPSDTYSVGITVTDDDTGSGSGSSSVTVNNVAPSAVSASLSATSINENGSTSLSGSFTDPGTLDTHTVVIDWGDGNSDTLNLGAGVLSFGPVSHTYLDDDPSGTASDNYSISVTVTDDDTGSGSGSTSVTVNNVAPDINNGDLSLSATTINENGSTSLSGSFADPGTLDTHTVEINWGDGSANTTLNLAAGVLSFGPVSHTYLDDGASPGNGTPSDTHSINVTVTDDDTGSDTASASVTVNNVAPAISSVSATPSLLAVNNSTTVTANFTDVGSQDAHTCTFDWDDPTADTTVPAPGTGNGSCSDTHTYAAAGVYTVRVTVTDDDTGSATSKYEFVVVYDPSAGFVTGGGWINSPAGAYVANPSLTGKANFGFVSKYKKGATVPTGETEFQFHVASFNFHSEAYQWLVVSGPKAQYKGTGKVNGVSGYGFLLTATDGQVSGGGGVDKFRIKIWRLTDGVVVYDNVPGASEDIDEANPQAISGGSIVIHK